MSYFAEVIDPVLIPWSSLFLDLPAVFTLNHIHTFEKNDFLFRTDEVKKILVSGFGILDPLYIEGTSTDIVQSAVITQL